MNRRAFSVAWAYAALTLFFIGFAVLRLPYGEGLRHPTILFARDAAQDLGGLIPKGLWQLDQERLRRSMGRISSVRFLRETGNSIRVAGGQVLEWIVWGGRDPLMLFPNIDLWISRGLTPETERDLTHAAGIIAEYKKRLGAEGWSLVVLPIPVKLGIHRELCEWPVRELNLLSRELLHEDRSDEVHQFMIEQLALQGVAAVDLQSLYRREVSRRPGVLLFIPGDSHWTGEGIRLAAKATAGAISRVSRIRDREPRNPTYHEFEHVADMAKSFDTLPGFSSRLRQASTFRDRLMNGEAGRGYPYPERPSGLVAAVGTSYTGHYTWIPQPVGFAWQLGLHLENIEVQNRPTAGKGSFHAFAEFWDQRDRIAADFEARNGPGRPKVVVWEFPIRDVKGILSSPGPR